MKQANWAEWSIKHRQLVYFFAVLTFLSGFFAWFSMGRSEDPTFTVRTMLVSTVWPGATAKEVEMHITEKLEKQIQNIPQIDKIVSQSRPGTSVIEVSFKDNLKKDLVRQRLIETRNMVEDIKRKLPPGVYGPYYNDRFDDVYGNIYALSGEGYSYEDMRKYGEQIKLEFSYIKDVKRVELIGVQPERIYIQMETDKLAQLGLDVSSLAAMINAQLSVNASGMVDTDKTNTYLRLTGNADSVQEIAALPINANGKVFRLGDIATIKRGYADPAESKFYYNGQPAIGIALSMEDGGNNLDLGENVAKAIAKIQKDLPLGLELNQVANQPEVVKSSIAEFSESLWEAIVIVLVVSLFTLGRRSGYVISCCIPLILLGSFAAMYAMNIDLQKISLGTLVLALGMLVDDAIVVVELMELKMSEGMERIEAASYAFKTCAWPLLTGTVITCLGFMPIAFSESASSEFCYSLFPVMSVTLLLSWVVSATLAPVLGYEWIRPTVIKKESFDSSFYKMLRSLLHWSLTHRLAVITITLITLGTSLFLARFVKQEFFPSSVRPELLVEINLPEGSSRLATDAAAQKLTAAILKDKDLDHVSTYVAEGAPRFVLVISPVTPRDNYAQLVIVAKDLEGRQRLDQKIRELAPTLIPEAITHNKTIPLGPPTDYPVMLRVRGSDIAKIKEIALKVRQVMAANPNINVTHVDWLTESNVLKLTIDNDKLLQLGLTRQTVANALQAQVSGYTVAQYLEGDQEISVVFRLNPKERADLSQIGTVSIPTAKGAIPLSQVAKLDYGTEDNIIWRRNLLPTITVSGGIIEGTTGNDVTKQVYQELAELRKQLPLGVSIDIGGPLEESQKTLKKLLAPIPIMLLLIVILLMLQMQDIRKLLVVMITAPMGIIGVILGLLFFNSTLGFMSELGVLALTGTIIRNSMVLVDQIQQHLDAGMAPLQAVTESAIVRFRPIMLAAFTTVLGLVPLFFSSFWNPMAVAISCGLTGATLLTLVVLPVLYAIVFKIK